jgi:hypothetical protein
MEPLKEQAEEVPDSLEFHPITNPEVSAMKPSYAQEGLPTSPCWS